MSRRYTRRGTALLLVLALLVSMLGAALPVMQKSGAVSGTFATAYTALLEKAPVAQADLERDPYGLCRLVVTGYGGKDYGAVAAAVTDGLAILQYDTPLAARKAAAQLAQDGATAEPDSLCQLETDTNLTGNLCPWAGEMVGATAFCARRQIPGHQVVIAQIDTGFMLDHPALQGRLMSDGIDLSGDGRANAAYDTRQRGATYWHATAVASVLAGNTDENVKILPYKVVRFGTDTCTASAVLAAMEDAVAKGARVLNMSLSTSQNRAGFAAMMDKAAALGVAVCCSAGNVGAQISNRYPSALPQAITVSAVTADKTVAGFSNYGDLVDYCAPGSHITVATMDSGGAPAATTASGTSLSCPYGAACCALLLSLHPDLTLDQLNALLQGSAEDLGDPGFDPIYGNGLLRLDNLTQTGTTGNLTYTLTLPEGTLALTGTGDGADYDRAAATPWALWAEELQQITVADTVTGLGNFTFSGCQNAVLTLPETLQRLGAYVFENCNGLHTITLPRNVVQVGTGVFSGCSDLTVRGWRNTPAPRAAAAAGAAFLPLGCVHNYVCQILRPTDTDPGSLTYTCAVCGDTYTEPYAEPQVLGSGSCGRGVNWTCYATGQLEITGTGRLSAYSSSAAPWAAYADTVSSVFIGQGVTGVTGYAFADMRRVTAFSVAGDDYTVAEGVLYSGDGTELICYPGGRVATDFTIPNGVTAVYAAAFLSAWQLQQVESASAALTVTADGLTLYGYYDTSVMDYARQHGLTFVPLGCLHRIYTDSGPAPTCTAGATHSRTCARCGADLGTVELPPNGHTYSETVQTAPTCTATGCSNYTCTVCGDSYTADTPALGHNWVQRAYTAPTCCVAGRVQRYCARCGTEETNILSPTQPEGHFVKGTVTDKAGAPLENISVSLDGTPVAVTNENGVFLFEGVSCGDYTLTFCGAGCVPRRVPLSVSGGNTTAPAAVLLLVGDLNGDGYVNARDDVLAQRQEVSPSDGANLSVNRVLPEVTLDRIYGVQAKIGVLYIRQSAEEDGTYRRRFEVNVRAFNEYRVVDCGFLYGKNMAETDLVPERAGATNAQGYAVKRMPAACTSGRKVLLYGSSSATGQVSARFYVTYTNGVMTKTYLSEVCTYDYDEA